jgi:hypothetical protein
MSKQLNPVSNGRFFLFKRQIHKKEPTGAFGRLSLCLLTLLK